MNEFDKSTATVLIVDDMQENIRVLSQTLETQGYKILVALNGKSAIDRAKYGQPDLVLLDIMMEGLDGFETCAIIKANPETKDIPIVFMTALSDTSDKIKGFQAGAVDYITKPFQAEEVLIRVKTHVSNSRLQKRLENYSEHLEEKVKERTKELIAAKEKAEQADRLKSEFLAQISHEIRTPLNGILGSISFLEDKLLETGDLETKTDIFIVKNSSMRLLRTMDLLMNVSELHAGTRAFDYMRFELIRGCLSPLFSIYENKTEVKSIDFKLTSKIENAYVLTDVEAVNTIMEHLIQNAINFTDNGEIEVGVEQNEEGNIVVFVRDTGIGMSEEYLEKLYDAFSQEHQGLARDFEGNGLGLTLVKLLCEALSINISVESEKNVGSKFTLIFTK